ncbi:MAG: hypothetical protein QOE23_434 [Pseudonocardiales bacterium]|nr:hypothetical protein [Pseudonocardiales bacterium]
MRWLAATILTTTLAVTGCASTTTTGSAGSNPTGQPGGGTSSTGTSSTGQPSSSQPSTSQPSTGQAGPPIAARCPAQLDQGQANRKGSKPVPGDLQVDWVLRCSVVAQAGGTHYLVAERSDSDPGALLAALRTPDEAPSKGACPAIAMVVPYFALIEPDGTGLLPRLPMTGCRLPQAAAVQALNALRFTVISRTRLP